MRSRTMNSLCYLEPPVTRDLGARSKGRLREFSKQKLTETAGARDENLPPSTFI